MLLISATNKRPGTDHMICGPMRCLNRQTNNQTDGKPDRQTWKNKIYLHKQVLSQNYYTRKSAELQKKKK